jgi:GNAT superfamily N-acetyltransferase
LAYKASDSIMTHELRAPASDAEWASYHEIRRRVLFERRGRGAEYDPHHPDETKPGNHPLLLLRDGIPVGVIRVDVDGDRAIFRRVAIHEDEQRRGHGRALLEAAEAFARAHGCTRVESHVDAGAVRFYERCGFRAAAPAPTDAGGTVFMTKPLG